MILSNPYFILGPSFKIFSHLFLFAFIQNQMNQAPVKPGTEVATARSYMLSAWRLTAGRSRSKITTESC